MEKYYAHTMERASRNHRISSAGMLSAEIAGLMQQQRVLPPEPAFSEKRNALNVAIKALYGQISPKRRGRVRRWAFDQVEREDALASLAGVSFD